MTEYNRMQLIKRRFFAMRNGIIADTLRKAGLDYHMIFGLNLPQVAEIASEQTHTPELAEELWADRRTRESMLLATMLYPPELMDRPTAMRWLTEAPTTEIADTLCLKLLRYVDGALDIALEAMTSDVALTRYTSLRLLFNLLNISEPSRRAITASNLRPFVEAELAASVPLTRPIALQMLDEIDYLLEDS